MLEPERQGGAFHTSRKHREAKLWFFYKTPSANFFHRTRRMTASVNPFWMVRMMLMFGWYWWIHSPSALFRASAWMVRWLTRNYELLCRKSALENGALRRFCLLGGAARPALYPKGRSEARKWPIWTEWRPRKCKYHGPTRDRPIKYQTLWEDWLRHHCRTLVA